MARPTRAGDRRQPGGNARHRLAAIWITGALGLAIATSYWPLGLVAGVVTAIILFVADSFPDEVREEKQEL